jgi:hypothetical protein
MATRDLAHQREAESDPVAAARASIERFECAFGLIVGNAGAAPERS